MYSIIIDVRISFNTDVHNTISYLCAYRRLGSGLFSSLTSTCALSLCPRQLPFLMLPHIELTTRRAWVFLQNSCTVGFSVPPFGTDSRKTSSVGPGTTSHLRTQ